MATTHATVMTMMMKQTPPATASNIMSHDCVALELAAIVATGMCVVLMATSSVSSVDAMLLFDVVVVN